MIFFVQQAGSLTSQPAAMLFTSFYSLFMRRNFCVFGVVYQANPDVVSFNTQNPIPHKSQKTKGFLETSRAKEV